MQNISKGKLGWNSLNASLRCCWRKGTCATQILEQQLIRGGKTVLLLQLMAWAGNPQTNTETCTCTCTYTCTRTCTRSHIHTMDICQISVSLSKVLHSSELISEPSRSFPQGLLKECRPEIPRNWFPPFNDTEDRVMSCTGPWCTRHGGTHPRRVHNLISKCVCFCEMCVCVCLHYSVICQGKEWLWAHVFLWSQWGVWWVDRMC